MPVALHRPLEVYESSGLQKMTDRLIAAYAEDIAVRSSPGGEHEGEAAPVVRLHEIAPGVVYRDSLVTATAFLEHHGTWAQAFGYRIQTPDKVIVLSGDTGPPSGVVGQCQGCALLLHEGGTVLAADATPYFWRFHTTVEDLAKIARRRGPTSGAVSSAAGRAGVGAELCGAAGAVCGVVRGGARS